MANRVTFGFHEDAFYVPVGQILPLRAVTENLRDSVKYKCIAASLTEVGMIEPLVVYPQPGTPQMYLLLDGVLRLDIIKARGQELVLCLKATEDDAYTHNHKVNQLSPIQEHFMILRALDNGASEERIAATLNVDVPAIRRKRDLLVGICPEAVRILKDRRISPGALREVKRVTPLRQVEMAELMTSVNNFSTSYAKCLYAATSEEQKLHGDTPEEDRGLSAEDSERMRRETTSLHREIKAIEETYGENVLNLVPAIGFIRRLLGNARVVKYLQSQHPDIAAEFRKLVDDPMLGPAEDS